MMRVMMLESALDSQLKDAFGILSVVYYIEIYK